MVHLLLKAQGWQPKITGMAEERFFSRAMVRKLSCSLSHFIAVDSGAGSFQLTAQEISTIIRHDLDVIVFVIEKEGYTTVSQLIQRTVRRRGLIGV